MNNGLVRIGILGRDYMYKYNISNLTEEIIENSIADKSEILWLIPGFPTKVHVAARKWLEYKGQNIQTYDMPNIFDDSDIGLVFWDNMDEAVLAAANELTNRKKVCYVIDDAPKLEVKLL